MENRYPLHLVGFSSIYSCWDMLKMMLLDIHSLYSKESTGIYILKYVLK